MLRPGWFNANPIKAYGTGGRSRPFLGDCWDHFSVIFFFPDDVEVSFTSKQVGFGFDDIMVRAHGMTGTAETNLRWEVLVAQPGRYFRLAPPTTFTRSAFEHNIASFYQDITRARFPTPRLLRASGANLTTILGRTAAYKGAEVTWDEILKKNEKWDFDLKGLRSLRVR
jgi:hypothetical protein